MKHFTLLVDVAGQLSKSTSGSARVTAAAVAVDSKNIAALIALLPQELPKWSSCSRENVASVVRLLSTVVAAVGIFSVNKDTAAWGRFWLDAAPLHNSIVAESHSPAGFVKPANILKFYLFGMASAVAMAHAIREEGAGEFLDAQGRRIVERTVICDSDVQGEENTELFCSLWQRHDSRQPRVASLGLRIVTREVRLATEQEEPLLMLADYAAGISHAAMIENPGRVRLPLTQAEALAQLRTLHATGKLVAQDVPFDITYDEVFGSLMDAARGRKPSKRSSKEPK